MFEKLLPEFIDDLIIEGVKLQIQLRNAKGVVENNSVLRTFQTIDIDTDEMMTIFRKELIKVKRCSSIDELSALVTTWHREHVVAQFDNSWSKEERAKVHGYVFLLRILRKRHKKLHKLVTS